MAGDASYVLLHEADDVVKKLCSKYPEELANVSLDEVAIVAIEGVDRPETKKCFAKIKGLRPPVSLLTSGKNYIVELYMSDWENWTVAQRNIVIFHELLHINGEGKNKKHDLEDFKMLVNKLGIDYAGNPDVVDILAEDVDWSIHKSAEESNEKK